MKQRFSKRTRLVSALLTLAMIFTFLPFSAFAANTASTEIDFNSPDFKLNFPDEEFRRFLKECCDTNGDGKLDVDIKNMTIPTGYAITSLEGIRFFEDLEKLDCHGIGLTTLNVTKNFKLEELNCSDNQLKDYLYILSNGLKKLNCSNNKLTSMNLGILPGLNLEEVDCSNNNITNIVMWSVGELVKFDCSNNALMSLDVSQCSKLQQLNCAGNQLMELDVSSQTQLTELDCHNNKLTELNVEQNGSLTSLICNDNNHVAAQKLRALLPPDVSLPENRAKTALLLWDTAGRPEPAEAPAFADVADPDTAKAAQWCVEQGLMKRRLNGRFGPDGTVPAYRILNAYRQLTGQ